MEKSLVYLQKNPWLIHGKILDLFMEKPGFIYAKILGLFMEIS